MKEKTKENVLLKKIMNVIRTNIFLLRWLWMTANVIYKKDHGKINDLMDGNEYIKKI